MLHVVIRRVFELSDGLEDLTQACIFLHHISHAVGKLASISRTQALYSSSAVDEVQQTILEALDEIADEMNLDNF